MRTALDAPPDMLDGPEQNLVSNVRAYGWFRTRVLGLDDAPGYSITTGFQLIGHPELLMFSMKSEIIHAVFWEIFRDVQNDRPLPAGTRTDAVFGNLPAYAFPVARRYYEDFLGWNRWFYGGDHFSCLQIVWPDRAGNLPWETGFDPVFIPEQLDLTERGWAREVLD